MTFVKGGPCYRLHPVWTRELTETLIDMIGTHSYLSIAKRLGKSVDAVRKKARSLGYSLDRGTITLRELSRQTGYDRHQLRRAGRALKQKWKRATVSKLLIRQDQANEMVDYLFRESSRRRDGMNDYFRKLLESAQAITGPRKWERIGTSVYRKLDTYVWRDKKDWFRGTFPPATFRMCLVSIGLSAGGGMFFKTSGPYRTMAEARRAR